MNKLPGLGLVERARALFPLISREADEIERTRRLTQECAMLRAEIELLQRGRAPTTADRAGQ